MDKIKAGARRILLKAMSRWNTCSSTSSAQCQNQGTNAGKGQRELEEDEKGPLKVTVDLVAVAQAEPRLFEFLWLNGLDEARALFQEILTMGKEYEDDEEIPSLPKPFWAPRSMTVEITFSSVPHCVSGVDLTLDRTRLGEEKRGGELAAKQDRVSKAVKHFRAVLTSYMCRTQYVRGSSFKCPSCTDMTLPVRTRFLVRLPVDMVESECLRPPECSMCSRPMEEDVRQRDLGYCTMALFSPDDSDRYCGLNVVQVLVRDEYATLLKPGQTYEIVAMEIPPHPSSSFPVLDCLYVEKAQQFPISKWGANAAYFTQLPNFIHERLAKSPFHPWFIVESLTSFVAQGILPDDSYLGLRTAILLSLSAKTSLPLHLLVSSDDVCLSRLALESAWHLLGSSKCVRFRPSVASLDDTVDQLNGGIILATSDDLGGIGCGKLTRQLMSMLSDSGSERMADGTSSKDSGCSSRCTLWMLVALNPSGRKRQKRTANMGEEQTKNLAELFGTAFMLKTTAKGVSAPAAESQLAEHLLIGRQKGWGTTNSAEVYHDLKMFLCQLRDRNLTFDDDALSLLKRYFVSSRRVREAETEVSRAAMATLTNMAECHAKVSLHSSIRLSDAIAAVYLAEKNLYELNGYSFLDETGEIFNSHVGHPHGLDTPRTMLNFYHMLVRFNASYSGDVTFEE